uniref:Pentacotripeptide-repeat region of PRORP domain-containing protein n=1 Tax=Chromera velia CCMP2878 TaxID=1169474 RepID=A0A0G4G7W3_9ALVE|eukprot:Cvel_20665.t1-p1 / transcript=Cvel_20665.t1 / gene=Cvel_20665 / organism=Chromera_velia_CCMP2878 / gene_product=hypothetical protein / transcript_product=hypothetical protein / location=Cvel_scaffold1876:10453-16106(-) / protein_length=1646 / sequence_SO=supercontig / SO=protein_coding / is_pseudo=false
MARGQENLLIWAPGIWCLLVLVLICLSTPCSSFQQSFFPRGGRNAREVSLYLTGVSPLPLSASNRQFYRFSSSALHQSIAERLYTDTKKAARWRPSPKRGTPPTARKVSPTPHLSHSPVRDWRPREALNVLKDDADEFVSDFRECVEREKSHRQKGQPVNLDFLPIMRESGMTSVKRIADFRHYPDSDLDLHPFTEASRIFSSLLDLTEEAEALRDRKEGVSALHTQEDRQNVGTALGALLRAAHPNPKAVREVIELRKRAGKAGRKRSKGGAGDSDHDGLREGGEEGEVGGVDRDDELPALSFQGVRILIYGLRGGAIDWPGSDELKWRVAWREYQKSSALFHLDAKGGDFPWQGFCGERIDYRRSACLSGIFYLLSLAPHTASVEEIHAIFRDTLEIRKRRARLGKDDWHNALIHLASVLTVLSKPKMKPRWKEALQIFEEWKKFEKDEIAPLLPNPQRVSPLNPDWVCRNVLLLVVARAFVAEEAPLSVLIETFNACHSSKGSIPTPAIHRRSGERPIGDTAESRDRKGRETADPSRWVNRIRGVGLIGEAWKFGQYLWEEMGRQGLKRTVWSYNAILFLHARSLHALNYWRNQKRLGSTKYAQPMIEAMMGEGEYVEPLRSSASPEESWLLRHANEIVEEMEKRGVHPDGTTAAVCLKLAADSSCVNPYDLPSRLNPLRILSGGFPRHEVAVGALLQLWKKGTHLGHPSPLNIVREAEKAGIAVIGNGRLSRDLLLALLFPRSRLRPNGRGTIQWKAALNFILKMRRSGSPVLPHLYALLLVGMKDSGLGWNEALLVLELLEEDNRWRGRGGKREVSKAEKRVKFFLKTGELPSNEGEADWGSEERDARAFAAAAGDIGLLNVLLQMAKEEGKADSLRRTLVCVDYVLGSFGGGGSVLDEEQAMKGPFSAPPEDPADWGASEYAFTYSTEKGNVRQKTQCERKLWNNCIDAIGKAHLRCRLLDAAHRRHKYLEFLDRAPSPPDENDSLRVAFSRLIARAGRAEFDVLPGEDLEASPRLAWPVRRYAVFDLWEGMQARGITPDVVSYSTFILAVVRLGLPESREICESIYSEMKTKGISPSPFTYNAMILARSASGYSNTGDSLIPLACRPPDWAGVLDVLREAEEAGFALDLSMAASACRAMATASAINAIPFPEVAKLWARLEETGIFLDKSDGAPPSDPSASSSQMQEEEKDGGTALNPKVAALLLFWFLMAVRRSGGKDPRVAFVLATRAYKQIKAAANLEAEQLRAPQALLRDILGDFSEKTDWQRSDEIVRSKDLVGVEENGDDFSEKGIEHQVAWLMRLLESAEGEAETVRAGGEGSVEGHEEEKHPVSVSSSQQKSQQGEDPRGTPDPDVLSEADRLASSFVVSGENPFTSSHASETKDENRNEEEKGEGEEEQHASLTSPAQPPPESSDRSIPPPVSAAEPQSATAEAVASDRPHYPPSFPPPHPLMEEAVRREGLPSHSSGCSPPSLHPFREETEDGRSVSLSSRSGQSSAHRRLMSLWRRKTESREDSASQEGERGGGDGVISPGQRRADQAESLESLGDEPELPLSSVLSLPPIPHPLPTESEEYVGDLQGEGYPFTRGEHLGTWKGRGRSKERDSSPTNCSQQLLTPEEVLRLQQGPSSLSRFERKKRLD